MEGLNGRICLVYTSSVISKFLHETNLTWNHFKKFLHSRLQNKST